MERSGPVKAPKSKFCLEPDWPYFGGCRPGDESWLLVREAVSACRAFFNRSSREMPDGISSACASFELPLKGVQQAKRLTQAEQELYSRVGFCQFSKR